MIGLYEVVVNLFVAALSLCLLMGGIFIGILVGSVLIDHYHERKERKIK